VRGSCAGKSEGAGGSRRPRAGVLGGTFNPVHEGHLAVARAASALLDLDRLFFIPASFPPHKRPSGLASGEDRLAMLRLAAAGVPGWEALDLELARGGVSYSVDTVAALKKMLGEETELFLIIGADNLDGISRWRRIEDLVRWCRFAVVTRPGFAPEPGGADDREWARRILAAGRGRLIELSAPVSSTEVRAAASRGEPLEGLVPPAVAAYIEKRGLYREPASKE